MLCLKFHARIMCISTFFNLEFLSRLWEALPPTWEWDLSSSPNLLISRTLKCLSNSMKQFFKLWNKIRKKFTDISSWINWLSANYKLPDSSLIHVASLAQVQNSIFDNSTDPSSGYQKLAWQCPLYIFSLPILNQKSCHFC